MSKLCLFADSTSNTISAQVLTGLGLYDSDDFAAIRSQGIKTIVSVDGAKPNVELAKQYGMEYVHIPIGYDAVEPEQIAQLVKVMKEREGPIYVHCHHGKHRGPAAAMCMLVGAGEISNAEAIARMEAIGTSKDYAGLYRDVRNLTPLTPEQIAAAPELQEVTEVSDLAAAMAQIDIIWDNLLLVRENGWQPLPDHPDIDPPHEALMLNEHFRELVRQSEEADIPQEQADALKEYASIMKSSEQESAKLEEGLRNGEEPVWLETRFRSLKQTCTDCHELYRN